MHLWHLDGAKNGQPLTVNVSPPHLKSQLGSREAWSGPLLFLRDLSHDMQLPKEQRVATGTRVL